MSYTFRVVFDGICAYVPNQLFFKDLGKKQPNTVPKTTNPSPHYGEKWTACDVDSLAVLLPDLRNPGRPIVPTYPRLNFPSFRAPHFPLLKFQLGDLRESTTRRVDLVCRDISQRDEVGLLFLRREQIRFNMQAENAGKFSFANWKPGNYRQPLPKLDQPEQMESLWWLPDLQRILPENSDADIVRSDVLPSYRGPFPEGLIARVECTGGRLRTYNFNRDVNDVPLRWRFAAPADAWSEGSWNRALANSVALEFFDVRNEVRIQLKRLANEVVTEELVLAPAPGASRPLLQIEITNREPDLLFQEEGFGRLTLPDMDFQPFYEFLSRPPVDVAQLPIPHPGRLSFFGIRENPCAGTVMTAQGDANA